jgi:F-type H+-transporting ATPase subunit delta
MLRTLSTRLGRSSFLSAIGTRSVSTSAARFADGGGDAAASDKQRIEAFLDRFTKVAPSTLTPPNFPSEHISEAAEAAKKGKQEEAPSSDVPDKLTFSFYLPHATLGKAKKVDLVLLPATTGDFGVMPGHVPTVAQLRPGVVTIHSELDKDIEKYFVSAGFAFINADSTTDVCAVEAVKLEDLDPEAVRAGLSEYQAKLGSLQGKADDYEIAAAQIGVEVYSAMNSALGL